MQTHSRNLGVSLSRSLLHYIIQYVCPFRLDNIRATKLLRCLPTHPRLYNKFSSSRILYIYILEATLTIDRNFKGRKVVTSNDRKFVESNTRSIIYRKMTVEFTRLSSPSRLRQKRDKFSNRRTRRRKKVRNGTFDRGISIIVRTTNTHRCNSYANV